ncbi:MAG: hypothetical protein A4S09_15970 [Proteobacteria bacterium SG_bin7]|nr:MAG: hypothetical protein A4S09_15970 [Proteobacteria bacterium SG_bin7]
MIRFFFSLVLFALNFSSTASARVFNFADLNVSSYLRGAGGTAYFGNDAFGNAGGSGATYSEGVLYQFSGEFGFSFELSSMTARLGFEMHRPQHLTNYEAKNSGGTTLYYVDSDIISYSPTLTFEIPLSKSQTTKSYTFLGAGYAYVTMKNQITFTSAGTSAYSLADFIEDTKGQTIFGIAGWGFETLMVDNVTFGMEFGYRYMEVYRMVHKAASTNFLGSSAEGSAVKNTGGTDRFLNLSQPFMSFVFRFYI